MNTLPTLQSADWSRPRRSDAGYLIQHTGKRFRAIGVDERGTLIVSVATSLAGALNCIAKNAGPYVDGYAAAEALRMRERGMPPELIGEIEFIRDTLGEHGPSTDQHREDE